MTTSAPSRAKASATPAPIPELLPVTSARFFSTLPISLSVLLGYVFTFPYRLAPRQAGGIPYCRRPRECYFAQPSNSPPSYRRSSRSDAENLLRFQLEAGKIINRLVDSCDF